MMRMRLGARLREDHLGHGVHEWSSLEKSGRNGMDGVLALVSWCAGFAGVSRQATGEATRYFGSHEDMIFTDQGSAWLLGLGLVLRFGVLWRKGTKGKKETRKVRDGRCFCCLVWNGVVFSFGWVALLLRIDVALLAFCNRTAISYGLTLFSVLGWMTDGLMRLYLYSGHGPVNALLLE